MVGIQLVHSPRAPFASYIAAEVELPEGPASPTMSPEGAVASQWRSERMEGGSCRGLGRRDSIASMHSSCLARLPGVRLSHLCLDTPRSMYFCTICADADGITDHDKLQTHLLEYGWTPHRVSC